MGKSLTDLSRAVSHALRHEPWLYELELDDEGWTDVDALLRALAESKKWTGVSPEDLAAMMKALYGHSVPGKLRRAAAAPPAQLFHGTAPGVVAKIRESGLLPMARQYVHLSVDEETALAVGRRKSAEPVLLVVAAKQAWDAGVAFYAGNDKVWLADSVPPAFIEPSATARD
jgi:putative RNA 2'-phosphotransferase